MIHWALPGNFFSCKDETSPKTIWYKPLVLEPEPEPIGLCGSCSSNVGSAKLPDLTLGIIRRKLPHILNEPYQVCNILSSPWMGYPRSEADHLCQRIRSSGMYWSLLWPFGKPWTSVQFEVVHSSRLYIWVCPSQQIGIGAPWLSAGLFIRPRINLHPFRCSTGPFQSWNRP